MYMHHGLIEVQKLNVHIGMNGRTSVEILWQLADVHRTCRVREGNLRSFAYMDIAFSKEKKTQLG
jgi:hypothetical protein